MCIWKVAEEDRRCEYCSYKGGCETFPDAQIMNIVPGSVLFERASIMNELIGDNVLRRTRRANVVWARNMLCYSLFADGYGYSGIGRAVGLDHASVIHCVRRAKEMLRNPSMYGPEMAIWQKYSNLLSLQKQ